MKRKEPEPATTSNGGYDDDRVFEFDEEEVIWLNVTRSGKGIKILTADDRLYISSVANLKKLISGEYTGIRFTELVEVL